MILHLIMNSEQAIGQGRVPGNSAGRIEIRTRRLAADRIGMEVSDDGPGIAPEVVPHIFDPFLTTKPVYWCGPDCMALFRSTAVRSA